jgi:hypothetical protein
MQEVYVTLDNGGTPFIVSVFDNHVKVYLNGCLKVRKLVFSTEIEKIFVGRSILNNMTEFSGAGEGYEGNSILLKIPGEINNYVYIGESIYKFTTYAKIIAYYSPIGNNSVPYPYAIDELGNYYLVTENVVVKYDPKLVELIQIGEDPYSFYYNKSDFGPEILESMGDLPIPQEPIVAKFNQIKKFKVGDETCRLTYYPYPHIEFDALKKRCKVNTLSIVKKDDTKVDLTKELYIDLMEAFGELIKVKPIMGKVMIHERV